MRSGAGPVVEAVFEDRDVKRSVFAAVEAAYGGGPVLATNTSGLPLDELAVGLSILTASSPCTFSCPRIFPDD